MNAGACLAPQTGLAARSGRLAGRSLASKPARALQPLRGACQQGEGSGRPLSAAWAPALPPNSLPGQSGCGSCRPSPLHWLPLPRGSAAAAATAAASRPASPPLQACARWWPRRRRPPRRKRARSRRCSWASRATRRWVLAPSGLTPAARALAPTRAALRALHLLPPVPPCAQLLGMKGASEETDIWKIRVQLMKPVTWIPLIWGASRPLARTLDGWVLPAWWLAGRGRLAPAACSCCLHPAARA